MQKRAGGSDRDRAGRGPAWALLGLVLVSLLLAGCGSGSSLVRYTSAGYATPDGYSYPSVAAIGPNALPGTKENPGPADTSAASTFGNATEVFSAYLRADLDPNEYIASLAARMRQDVPTGVQDRIRANCPQRASILVDRDVLIFVQWSDHPRAQQDGPQIAAQIQKATGATPLCPPATSSAT